MNAVQGALSRARERAEASLGGTLMPWYQGLSPREQRLVAVAAAMLLVGFLAFGIAMPLHARQIAMQQEVARLAMRAQEANDLADSLQQGGGRQPADLLSAVEQVSIRSGVRAYMTRIRPKTGADGGRQLSLQLTGVPYANVVAFVTALHRRHIGLERLRMQAADQPGDVHVDAVVSGS